MRTTTTTAAHLVLDRAVVRHHGRTLVDVTDLRLEPGRAVTVVGQSGSGKSLLAHALMGTLAAGLDAEGRFEVADDTRGTRAFDLARPHVQRRLWGSHVALLPQEPVLALDPTMRVGRQVAEGARGADRGLRAQVAADALASVGLGHTARAYPHTLSGGMAQRVAFAAATVGGAPVLVADEPSKGLDTAARDALADLLGRHLDAGGSLLTITHDLELARRLGGELLVMRDALVVERGEVEQVLAAPEHPWTRRLLAADPSRWARDAWARGVHDDDTDHEVLLEATGVGTSLGGRRLFDDVDLELRRGDRVALTGPSGAGKTTLGDVLLRVRRPDDGRVEHGAALADGRMQKLYQDPAVAFPPRVPLRVALADVVRRHRVDPARVPALLGHVGIDPAMLHRLPGEVSGGELQRIALVRALLLDPTLLFADEPTSRLDLITQQETFRCLMAQVVDRGCALLLVTHDEALAAATTTRRVTVGQG